MIPMFLFNFFGAKIDSSSYYKIGTSICQILGFLISPTFNLFESLLFLFQKFVASLL